MSSPRSHNFWIREGNGKKWKWLAVNSNDVAKYSGRLGRQVKEDKHSGSSQVELCDGVTEDALKVIISSIPSKEDEGDLPVLCINERDPEFGFDQLLSLAIACWKFDCAIPPVCEKFAQDFHVNWTRSHKHDFAKEAPSVSKAINWMFIGLVFKWDRIFRDASRFVVVKYKSDENNTNLPQDFQELIRNTRKRKIQQTYTFVKNSWISFYDPPNKMLNEIHTHFKTKLGIELHNSPPKGLFERANPDNLLVELAATVKINQSGRPRLPPPPLEFDAPAPGIKTQGTGRGSLFAPVAASVGRDLLEAAKRTMMNRGHTARSPSSSSSEQSWKQMQSLEKNMNDFRTRSLDGILLADEEFMDLRNQHIRPIISGFQPKNKRE